MNLFKSIAIAAVVTFATIGAHSDDLLAQSNESECQKLWTSIDADANGELTQAEDINRYLDALIKRNQQTVRPGALSRQEFLNHCALGTFANIKGEPVNPGVNVTATERDNAAGGRGKGDITPGLTPLSLAEAEKRVRASGFRIVSPLTLDKEGIWRAKAVLNGKEVNVAVDPQGDIATQ